MVMEIGRKKEISMTLDDQYNALDQPQEVAADLSSKSGKRVTESSAIGTEGIDIATLNKVLLGLARIASKESVSMTFKAETLTCEQKNLMQELNHRLSGEHPIPLSSETYKGGCIRPLSVAFPPSSDVLLALIKSSETDQVTGHFNEYFSFCSHSTIIEGFNQGEKLEHVLDPNLLRCTRKLPEALGYGTCDDSSVQIAAPSASQIIANTDPSESCKKFFDQKDADCSKEYSERAPSFWPSQWCLPSFCVTLRGDRHLYQDPSTGARPTGKIKRLFIADLVWLFYFEKMGLLQILGVILDDYAIKGKIPISNGSIEKGVKDDVISLILEAMVRETTLGLSSRVRDRDSTYRRCLGWTSDTGRKLGLDSVVNTAFNSLFHRFIQNALDFYKERRLAEAIKLGGGAPSAATLITISDTIDLLKKSFDSFDYGRNYYNTLSGIVWAISAMSLIRELRTTLGIPSAYDQPYEFIPAAYDLLVMKRPITPTEANRYTLCRECANDARDILLDMEVIDNKDERPGGMLEMWLTIIESKIEGYRTAYRSLTGVDLGMPPAPGTPRIEQQA
jgi:hypothetical protein